MNTSGDILLSQAIQGQADFSSAIAQHVFKRFAALVYRLVIVEGNDYGLLAGAGDSGAVLVYFTDLVYQAIGKNTPPRLVLPVQRFIDPASEDSGRFNNSVLLPLARKELQGLMPSRVLFVDDEIWKANSASAVARILAGCVEGAVSRILFTIVAENHGFEWHYDIPPVAIQYFAFSKKIPGQNNVILRLLEEDEQQRVDSLTAPFTGQTQKMDLVCNNQVKVQSRPGKECVPHFSAGGLSAPAIRDLALCKDCLEQKLCVLISQAIREYEQGDIRFVF